MKAGNRGIWNGAVSFGLVNIPVSIHLAADRSGLDFTMLDKRSLDPVGYKRINKRTGEEMATENIVKGLEYEEGRYVVLSEEEIRQALPRSTQTIEIESFVPAAAISPVFFERPYYLVPLAHGTKAYALLRETLQQASLVGVARIVIATRQHLAAMVPAGPALLLLLLRWAGQLRPADELALPPAGTEGLSEKELAMASQLVAAMAGPWQPEQFSDSFTAKLQALVDEKVKAGEIRTALEQEGEEAGPAAEVIDISELLRRSISRQKDRQPAGA